MIQGWDCPDEDKYLDAVATLASPNTLIDEESQSLLRMYYQCKDLGMQPFPGCWWDQPAFWVDAHQIIMHNTNIASAAKNNTDEHTQKIKHQGPNPREVRA